MTPTRIGILTSGGDCPGLNAVIRAVVSGAHQLGWEVLGFIDGYEGLLSPMQYRPLTPSNTDGIMALGGTIIGTTNRGRFVAKIGHGDKAAIDPVVLNEARDNLRALGVDALVCIGGDGSLSTALQLQAVGVNCVGVPKTIDNDLSATAMTFGFDSAVQVVTDSLDRLHTTAASHKRIMIVEVMGRYAGWIALHGGIAGGANMILIPEIPFSYEAVRHHIRQRHALGAPYTMIVASEGARAVGTDYAVQSNSSAGGEKRLGGIGQELLSQLNSVTDQEVRCVVLGHLQRGGHPTTLDRILGTRFGVAAVQMVRENQFGHMVGYQNYLTGSVSLEEAVGQLKTVPPDGQMVATARAVGIHFGDA